MLSRRSFLETSSSALLTSVSLGSGMAQAQTIQPHQLRVGMRTLDVSGRAATVLGITNAQGKQGMDMCQSDGFNGQV